MLDIALQILSVLGIILLVLLGLLLAVIMLAIFFPVIYRIFGECKGKDFSLDVKASWLFGLLRVRFAYPDPGKLMVKALWFTVFESESHEKIQAGSSKTETGEQKKPEGQEKPEEQKKPEGQEKEKESQEISQPEEHESSGGTGSGEEDGEPQKSKVFSDSIDADEEEEQADSQKGFQISERIKKIKYTFRGIYDKIKKIWQNITYYVELLQDRETRLLFHHVKSRIWKILKSIRPRKLRAQVLFGTGSPDTTGYAYGVYGMLLPLLGPDVIVTPDFCEAVLDGSFYAAGHITMAVLIWHTIRIFFDKRLKRFLDRLKHKDQDERSRDNRGKKGTKRKKKDRTDKIESSPQK